MIRLRNVSMQYALADSHVRVLDEVSLDVARGERIAITGPSGSGKTTLLLLLGGLERPTSGSVELDGQRLERLGADALADLRRDRIGIVFQSFHLVPSLNALENVALPLEIAGRTGARLRARELLEAVGLAARMAHYPSQLSGGEQQRVAIARALAHSPKLVLADEPTGNLDDRTGEAVAQLLFSLSEREGGALLLVTHNAALAARCDRVLRLHGGRLTDA